MTVACLRKAWRRCRRGAWRRRTALARTETVHSLPKSSTPARSLPVRAAAHTSHCGRPIGLRCLSQFKRRGAAGRGRHDVHLSARAHDLAHHRRLRYDGTRRRGRGDRAVFFWLGQPRTSLGTYVDYLSTILGFEKFRAGQFDIRHYCCIGLNPKEANDETLADAVLDVLPHFVAGGQTYR